MPESHSHVQIETDGCPFCGQPWNAQEFPLRERDLWMKQCLEAEAKVKAYETAFDQCTPLRNELASNYSPSVIALRWAIDRPTPLDRAVRDRA